MAINKKRKKKTKKLMICLSLRISTTDINFQKIDSLRMEFRRVYNEFIGVWYRTGKVSKSVFELHKFPHSLLANVRQSARDVAVEAVKSYFELKKENPYANPPAIKDEPMSPRLNYKEGYRIRSEVDNGEKFYKARITISPGDRVKVNLIGSEKQFTMLEKVLSGEYEIGSCNISKRKKKYYMNISLRNGEIPKPNNNKTFIGIDTNEKNIALSAINEHGEVLKSLILDYPVINSERQKYFVIRKWLQKINKDSVKKKIQNKEKLVVRDFYHKMSRIAVEWITQFSSPLIIMEDLTNIRNSINFGKRWNRRLHGWGFRTLQSMIEYKVNHCSIPVYYCHPALTSQTCAKCGLRKKSHKRKREFTCSWCGHVDHRDRNEA
ncbi:MAG: IS200/IS605 family element transposase accessory protein TnpB [Candidatus Helarchaeota archaeon]|nr:IS200/IS605 family element transposase accessory protein TnpB [Candidatus Helarchaeota archaeon]